MIKDDKRLITARLDVKDEKITRLIKINYDMVNQLLGANHEIGRKMEEIVELREKNGKLKSELTLDKYMNE